MSTYRTLNDVSSYRSAFPLDRAAYMVSAALADGGGTFDAATGRRAHLTIGFMVGGIPAGSVHTLATVDRSAQIDAVRILIRTAEAMRGSSVGIFVGAWLPGDGTIVWELSENEPYRTSAIANGMARGEIAIWDIANNAEIVL